MPSRRELNVAKFGNNNVMEAEGFDIVCAALKYDSRLTIEKCGEGTRADFVVHAGDPKRALGVQLKTTKLAGHVSKTCWQYKFSDTLGYSGLAVLCIALDSRVRMWLIPGNKVTGDNIRIPVESQSVRRGYVDWETYELDLADDFVKILMEDSPDYSFGPMANFMRPDSRNGQAEFDAFIRLQAALPLDFRPARIEGSHYDCTVDGMKWQLKLAGLNEATNRYSAALQKQAGRTLGKRKQSQYAEEDFDLLCVQMPVELESAYLFPMQVLIERRLAGREDCTTGTLHFYPHRYAHPKTEWVEEFKMDLSSKQQALSDYQRIVQAYVQL